jgi:low affinity Fe/Cu permease
MHAFHRRLEQFSVAVTHWAGSSWAFALAVAIVLTWALSGPIFSYSENWQLVINTGTTIVTFLMVFLIQRSQNKESLAVQVKLNELLASQQGASNRLINVEDLSEEDIAKLHERFNKLSARLDAATDNGEQHSVEEAREALEEAGQELSQIADLQDAPHHSRQSRRSAEAADPARQRLPQ